MADRKFMLAQRIRKASSVNILGSNQSNQRTFRSKKLINASKKIPSLSFTNLVPNEVMETIEDTKDQIDNALTYFDKKMKYTKQLEQTKLKYLNKITQLEEEIFELKKAKKIEENQLKLQQKLEQLQYKWEKQKAEAQKFCVLLLAARKKITHLEKLLIESNKQKQSFKKEYENLFRKYRLQAANPQKLLSLPYALVNFIKEDGSSRLKQFCLQRSDLNNSPNFFIQLDKFLKKQKIVGSSSVELSSSYR